MKDTQRAQFDTTPVDPTITAENGRIPLSVVVVTKNEAERIEDCLESVFQACRSVPAFEVILVDSDSSDRTVDLATEYDITVLRIPEEHVACAGTGRYVGDRVASGEMVLHVDGDMTLTEVWLPRAIAYLEAHNDVAGVEGCLDQSSQSEIREVDKLGGVMLYDADALAEAGGFDPYLLGYEDVDVGFQLREAGYRLVCLPEVSASHREEGMITKPLRRWRQGYYIAPGQTIRKRARSPAVLKRLLARQRYNVGLLGWVSLGVLTLFSLPLFVAWLLLSAIAFGVVASRLGVSGAVDFVIAKSFGTVGLLIGLKERTPPATEFPLSEIEVVATGRPFEGSVPREK